jgi:hypothetical protein
VTMRSHFTPVEHQRIQTAIATIEQSTAADLDMVVVRVSDRYSLYPFVWAAIGALLATGLAVLLRPELASRTAIVIQLSFLIVLTLLFDWLPIRLSLVPARVKHAHARQLAHREFAGAYNGRRFSSKPNPAVRSARRALRGDHRGPRNLRNGAWKRMGQNHQRFSGNREGRPSRRRLP